MGATCARPRTSPRAPLLRHIYRRADAVVDLRPARQPPTCARTARARSTSRPGGRQRVLVGAGAARAAAATASPRCSSGATRPRRASRCCSAWRAQAWRPRRGARLVGDGAERRPRAGVAPSGRAPGELRNFYAAADVLVVPSVPTRHFREPWGLVANEAMHQGTPRHRHRRGRRRRRRARARRAQRARRAGRRRRRAGRARCAACTTTRRCARGSAPAARGTSRAYTHRRLGRRAVARRWRRRTGQAAASLTATAADRRCACPLPARMRRCSQPARPAAWPRPRRRRRRGVDKLLRRLPATSTSTAPTPRRTTRGARRPPVRRRRVHGLPRGHPARAARAPRRRQSAPTTAAAAAPAPAAAAGVRRRAPTGTARGRDARPPASDATRRPAPRPSSARRREGRQRRRAGRRRRPARQPGRLGVGRLAATAATIAHAAARRARRCWPIAAPRRAAAAARPEPCPRTARSADPAAAARPAPSRRRGPRRRRRAALTLGARRRARRRRARGAGRPAARAADDGRDRARPRGGVLAAAAVARRRRARARLWGLASLALFGAARAAHRPVDHLGDRARRGLDRDQPHAQPTCRRSRPASRSCGSRRTLGVAARRRRCSPAVVVCGYALLTKVFPGALARTRSTRGCASRSATGTPSA